MSVWRSLTRERRRATAVLTVPVLLLGLNSASSGPAAPATAIRALAAAADLPPYQIGYVSTDVPRIAAVNLGGPVPRAPQTFTGRQPSAASGAVVFVRHRTGHADADLAYFAPGATTPAVLTADDFTDRHPALSPNGALVAFESDRGGQPDIWVVRVDGTGLRRITDNPAEDTWPTWSPSGDRLAFSSTRDDELGDIYTVSVGGGAVTRVTDDPAADLEPAFAPSGNQIAFTTTRFGSVANIATVPAGGGAATKVVAGEQAAWSPDGSAIAYVSRERDPSGDVHMFTPASGAQAVLSARRATAETAPTWSGPRVVLVEIVDSGGLEDDIWSADGLGGNRRDLTNRPAMAESGPSWSPDGDSLAYTEFNDESEARLVVSDGDGRGPRALTDFVERRRDTDPTWSPDGKMIAFTRTVEDFEGPASVTVTVVRVADGRILGSIPAPTNLSGVEDFEPSWSPDGTRLALVRGSTTVPMGPTSPPSVERPAYPGGSTSIDQVISTPVIAPKPDIVFMIDTTGSMDNTIDNVRRNIDAIVDAVMDAQPDPRFALVGYRGAGDNTGQYSAGYYKAMGLRTLDPQRTALKAALDGFVTGGGNGQEDWLFAMQRVLADDVDFGFRAEGTPIIVLIGDAPSANNRAHLTRPGSTDPSSPCPPGGPTPGPSITPQLVAERIRVIAAPIRTRQNPPELGLDFCGQATLITGINDGELLAETEEGAGGDIEGIRRIIAGLQNLRVTVTPTVQRCDPGLTVTLDPPGPTQVIGGTAVHYTQTATVASGATPGSTLRCGVTYALTPSGGTFFVPITIRVADAALPLVNVDDVTVRVPGPDGAAVNYTATAVDSGGRALTPTCTPPSGTVFPIGQALVTCTATDSGGRVGTDTAYITVSESDATTAPRIWVVTLTFPAPDGILVTAQTDLGTRVGAPCPLTPDDAGPAWSTDGSQLAFTRSGELCVTDAMGGRARTPLTTPLNESDILSDPAWSPDGMLIAFTWTEVESESTHATLRTVPVGGGPDTVLIDTPGGASQPAFRPLAPIGLSVTVAAQPQPSYVGGAPIVITAVGHNASRVVARRVWLSIQVPAELGGPPAPIFVETLAPGADFTLTVTLPAVRAVTGGAIATVSGSFSGDRVATARARTPVVVIQPVLRLDSALGPPGFVPVALGTGFPPGTTVTLAWQPGLSAGETAIVGPDGTFSRQVLVFYHDRLGPRRLAASGAGFGPVGTDFLVVSGTGQPNDFVDRR